MDTDSRHGEHTTRSEQLSFPGNVRIRLAALAATGMNAARVAAKRAEQFKIRNVNLPRAYARLGKHFYAQLNNIHEPPGNDVGARDFIDEVEKLLARCDALSGEIEVIAQASSHTRGQAVALVAIGAGVALLAIGVAMFAIADRDPPTPRLPGRASGDQMFAIADPPTRSDEYFERAVELTGLQPPSDEDIRIVKQSLVLGEEAIISGRHRDALLGSRGGRLETPEEQYSREYRERNAAAIDRVERHVEIMHVRKQLIIDDLVENVTGDQTAVIAAIKALNFNYLWIASRFDRSDWELEGTDQVNVDDVQIDELVKGSGMYRVWFRGSFPHGGPTRHTETMSLESAKQRLGKVQAFIRESR